MDVADFSSGHGGQDDRCFFSTQGVSLVGLPCPEAYQADAGGLLVGGHGDWSTSSHRPKFDSLGDRPRQVRRPWMVTTDSLASPDPGCSSDLTRSPSPCLNLDVLSSDDADESVGLSDILVTLLCGSDDGHTPVNSDQVLSGEDLPVSAGSRYRRQVIRIRDVSPDVQIVDISQVGRDWDSQRTVWGAGHPKDSTSKRMQQSACVQAPAMEVRAEDVTPGLAAAGPWPVVGTDVLPEVGWVETIQLSSPPRSGLFSPDSPGTIAFDDMGIPRCHCPPIMSRRGDHRMFRTIEVCLMCRQ